MRALIQRVSRAKVTVEGQETGKIDGGFVILLGVTHDDTEAIADRMWQKISQLRIFRDDQGKTNISLRDVAGQVLIVSQFTLYADLRKGNRPSFIKAADPEKGEALYEYFVNLARAELGDVACGVFGAEMQIELVNDGPFTIWLDSEIWEKK
ncbi:MAG TPA: D-tyrosyl-tRNA(Tyr) deacylase [Fastidiosipila sp.]|jgi:D-tyrosyl-tRNA(Tyr) deacylase|nr:D-tyrosyl-tRNA(Tyr) deacylase [Fastidiosipila sp.]